MSEQRPNRYAIIPTHNRRQRLTTLCSSLAGQVDMIVIIDNASEPPIKAMIDRGRRLIDTGTLIQVIRDDEQPPNLSRLWNVGLARVAEVQAASFHSLRHGDIATWDVAILNDDVEVWPGWFDGVAGQMRERGAAAAFSRPYGGEVLVTNEPDNHARRWLYGPAFIIRGELAAKPGDPLWAEERLRWWAGDNAMDVNAQRNGGVLAVSGDLVPNHHANESTTGALAEQAGRDRETFREIYGWYAW